MSSNPTQAQCNFPFKELHWVSHGAVGWKCPCFTLALSDIISWLDFVSPGLHFFAVDQVAHIFRFASHRMLDVVDFAVVLVHSVFLYIIPFSLHFSVFIYIFRENAPLWADLDGDEDQESLIQSKRQRRSTSEVDMSRKKDMH